jgi:uncharacterized protein YuzE
MHIEYDKSVEAVYIHLRDIPYAFGEDLDDSRRIVFGADGRPIGIELLNVDLGVKTDDLPEREAVAQLLEHYNIKVLV